MSENEVTAVLREIRERVRAEAVLRTPSSHARLDGSAPATTEGEASNSLTRLETNLSVTARAWDKLPPLVSYRQGYFRRLELWLKRQIKRATRWYTWEQVNFNAATNDALREALDALRAHDDQLAAMREEHEEQLKMLEEAHDEQLKTIKEEIATLASMVLVEKEIAGLQSQMRELTGQAFDEQRVCFKQFNLELSETLASTDRARRFTEARLDELARQVEELRRAASEREHLRPAAGASGGAS